MLWVILWTCWILLKFGVMGGTFCPMLVSNGFGAHLIPRLGLTLLRLVLLFPGPAVVMLMVLFRFFVVSRNRRALAIGELSKQMKLLRG
eukprot:6482804-Amphidinium_carterae.1